MLVMMLSDSSHMLCFGPFYFLGPSHLSHPHVSSFSVIYVFLHTCLCNVNQESHGNTPNLYIIPLSFKKERKKKTDNVDKSVEQMKLSLGKLFVSIY